MLTLSRRDGFLQPGPPESTVQCFIKRDRTSSDSTIYHLCLGLPPGPTEERPCLLAAKKFRRATCTEFIISLDPNNMSRSSSCFVGKLRSNFLGTRFSIYDSHSSSSDTDAVFPTNINKKRGSKKSKSNVARITYELNILGARRPRSMECTLYTIPTSAITNPRDFSARYSASSFRINDTLSCSSFSSSLHSRSAVADWSAVDESISTDVGLLTKDKPLVLKNKAPRWHEQLKCWCLNFRGRVTLASVKNFQLVAALDPTQTSTTQLAHRDKVLLQFGKIGKETFTMDYSYPLSAFQAFAICLSSFDNKIICDARHIMCFN